MRSSTQSNSSRSASLISGATAGGNHCGAIDDPPQVQHPLEQLVRVIVVENEIGQELFIVDARRRLAVSFQEGADDRPVDVQRLCARHEGRHPQPQQVNHMLPAGAADDRHLPSRPFHQFARLGNEIRALRLDVLNALDLDEHAMQQFGGENRRAEARVLHDDRQGRGLRQFPVEGVRAVRVGHGHVGDARHQHVGAQVLRLPGVLHSDPVRGGRHTDEDRRLTIHLLHDDLDQPPSIRVGNLVELGGEAEMADRNGAAFHAVLHQTPLASLVQIARFGDSGRHNGHHAPEPMRSLRGGLLCIRQIDIPPGFVASIFRRLMAGPRYTSLSSVFDIPVRTVACAKRTSVPQGPIRRPSDPGDLCDRRIVPVVS